MESGEDSHSGSVNQPRLAQLRSCRQSRVSRWRSCWARMRVDHKAVRTPMRTSCERGNKQHANSNSIESRWRRIPGRSQTGTPSIIASIVTVQQACWFRRLQCFRNVNICQPSVIRPVSVCILLHDVCVSFPTRPPPAVPCSGTSTSPMQETASLQEGAPQPNALQRYRHRQRVRAERVDRVTLAVCATGGALHGWPTV